MDITNIPQNLIKGLEQKNTEQLAVLSRVLNLVLGKPVIATVTSTAPVTPAERDELLKQTTAALTQLSQQTVGKLTPAVKNEIARLMQQQNLIQSPELKWINLVVNNRPLLTYSDRPIAAGQNIPIQLQSPQKLVLLDLPESASIELTSSKTLATAATSAATPLGAQQLLNTKSALAVNELVKTTIAELTNTIAPENKATVTGPLDLTKNAFVATNTSSNQSTSVSETAASKTIVPASLAVNDEVLTAATSTKTLQQNKINLYSTNDLSLKTTNQSDKHSNPETLAVKNLVSEQLRNILPHRDTPNTLFAAIDELQKLPAPSRSLLFSPSLEQALKSLAEKIRSPEQIAQPKVLAQTLKNSGVFFENKLNHLIAKPNTETQNTGNKLNQTYSQDLKGSLLTLLNRVTQELSGISKPISSEQTLRLFQNLGSPTLVSQSLSTPLSVNNKNDIAQALGILIQELMHKPAKELSNKELRTQLLVLLQQHSLHSLAKIQLQQLHSLNHELDTKDSSTPNASWQLDIPVKHHNDVQHVHVRIDREWVDEKKETESEKSSNKIKQWSVTLRFDLPTLGEFCAQLAIINTQVSATLWAEREKTFTEVREHIEGLRKQLEGEGINVKYLQCMRGMPPQKPMALSYSLIDIST